MTTVAPGLGLDPRGYASHWLHAPERAWQETNCYIDVWVELLHSLQLEVPACLGFTLCTDFEADQWTFGKPSHHDLAFLYGIDVHELTLWRSLLEHVVAQIGAGRVPLVEVDSYYLPDTAGTDYRREHVKTTVAMAAVDLEARRLGYFHNTGYHELSGEDFDGVFGRLRPALPGFLPPFCEIAKLDRTCRLPADDLRQRARVSARHHLAQRPTHNPFTRYGEHFAEHLQWMLAGASGVYHAYSFAAVRQFGAAFELGASFLRWLAGPMDSPLAAAAAEFDAIAQCAKTMILKLARVVHSGRSTDFAPALRQLAGHWARASECLEQELGAR